MLLKYFMYKIIKKIYNNFKKYILLIICCFAVIITIIMINKTRSALKIAFITGISLAIGFTLESFFKIIMILLSPDIEKKSKYLRSCISYYIFTLYLSLFIAIYVYYRFSISYLYLLIKLNTILYNSQLLQWFLKYQISHYIIRLIIWYFSFNFFCLIFRKAVPKKNNTKPIANFFNAILIKKFHLSHIFSILFFLLIPFWTSEIENPPHSKILTYMDYSILFNVASSLLFLFAKYFMKKVKEYKHIKELKNMAKSNNYFNSWTK